jgi:hypothetical protein
MCGLRYALKQMVILRSEDVKLKERGDTEINYDI